jgi:hypothetical protein
MAKIEIDVSFIKKGEAEALVANTTKEVKMSDDSSDLHKDLPRSIVWEVPPGTSAVVVELYNSDNSYNNSYTITDFISLHSGQKLKVIAK